MLYSNILENESNESIFQPNFSMDVHIENIFGNINAKNKWQSELFEQNFQSKNISKNLQNVNNKDHSLSNLSSPYIEPILFSKGTFQFV